eukprot:m.202411 g.202411  ORF g.202411 m.202411 type:complete len:335 (+) comp18828_c0_seq6:170-1174(+)
MFEIINQLLRLLLGACVIYLLFVCCWLWLHIEAFGYALNSKDKKWKQGVKTPDTIPAGASVRERDLVFIRHGESTWNDTFNRTKNPPFFAKRLVYAALYEIMLIVSGSKDSWFLDSPLSELGLSQAEALRTFMDNNKDHDESVRVILGKSSQTKSTVVFSNLRRAVSTGMLGLWDRLQAAGEKAIIHSDLQEISRNPDTMSVSEPFQATTPSWLDKAYKKVDFASGFENIIDASYNYGNKTVANNGQTRILSFFQWLFESDDRGTVICVGHSLWFRQVFQAFLPDSSKHLSKTKKIVNCGVIGLTLTEYSVDGGPVQYMIDPESVKVIYGGFQK